VSKGEQGLVFNQLMHFKALNNNGDEFIQCQTLATDGQGGQRSRWARRAEPT
jgi:hypothetical protein